MTWRARIRRAAEVGEAHDLQCPGDGLDVARLILESGGERREIRFAGPITLGRAKTATVHIDDKVLSREHTLFYVERGHYYVKDLESKNGTFHNGNLLRQPELLKHGDRVKAGPALFTFVGEPGDATAAPLTQTAPTVPAAAPPPAAPPAPAPARARPRTEAVPLASAVGPIARLVITLFLLGVVAVGAYFSKFVFAWLLDMVPR